MKKIKLYYLILNNSLISVPNEILSGDFETLTMMFFTGTE